MVYDLPVCSKRENRTSPERPREDQIEVTSNTGLQRHSRQMIPRTPILRWRATATPPRLIESRDRRSTTTNPVARAS